MQYILVMVIFLGGFESLLLAMEGAVAERRVCFSQKGDLAYLKTSPPASRLYEHKFILPESDLVVIELCTTRMI
jgi:hypothetical protein